MGLRHASFLASLLCFVACSSSGGGSSGGGTIDVSGDCAKACAAAAQNCSWSSTQQSDCANGCSKEYAGLPSACSSQANAAFSCANQPSAWDCSTNSPTNCNAQVDALESCQKQHTTSIPLQPYCDKCAACISDPAFSEGFCDPFINGTSFDVGACVQNGNPADIDDKTLTAAQLSAMTCVEYDNAI